MKNELALLAFSVESIEQQCKAFATEMQEPWDECASTHDSDNCDEAPEEEALNRGNEMKITALPMIESPSDLGTTLPNPNTVHCYLQTRSGNLKSYTMRIRAGHVILDRQSTKQQEEISYPLTSFQCLKSPITKSYICGSKGETSTFHCLLFVISDCKQRSVYFDSEAACEAHHTQILAEQGFLEKRMDAYEVL